MTVLCRYCQKPRGRHAAGSEPKCIGPDGFSLKTSFSAVDDSVRAHIVNGLFQSDKYPGCPPGKVPLSVRDPMAQDLLWEYAQRRRPVDAAFADDLEFALYRAGFSAFDPPSDEPTAPEGGRDG